jgi:flagellar biosynthesis regulator FlaF
VIPVAGPRGRGRPAKEYRLTDVGRSRLPHAYDTLAADAIAYLAEVGGDEAVTAFARRRAEALAANRRLWSLLASDCAGDGNQLSQSLRAQIISLSMFVDKHSSQVMRAGASFDVLIEINRTIMQGLSPAQPAVA